jgi:hypothetical protein
MSPRPAPSVRDETGLRFLQAGANLVDALLGAQRRDDLPPRLRSLHFPAPLDWIRIEDVIREAQQGASPVSAKAFWNRWPDKDSFMVDLAIHAITYGGEGSSPKTAELREGMVDTDATFAERIEALTASVMAELVGRPRSFLLGHLAAVAHHAPLLQAALEAAIDEDNASWTAYYEAVAATVGLGWRPGWDAARAQVTVQALIDGLLIRSRVVRSPAEGSLWDPVPLFADATTALFASILDLDADHRTVRQLLDDGVASRLRAASTSADAHA